jgi:hypothetical protein
MAGGDFSSADFGRRPAQKFIAEEPARLLQVQTAFSGSGPDVLLLKIKREIERGRQLVDEPRVPDRSGPQSMIEMGHGQAKGQVRSKLMKDMEQGR